MSDPVTLHALVAGLVALVGFLVTLVGFFVRRELKRIDDNISALRKELGAIEAFDRRLMVLEIQSDRLGRIRSADLERLETAKGNGR